jgi:hypothetical protein
MKKLRFFLVTVFLLSLVLVISGCADSRTRDQQDISSTQESSEQTDSIEELFETDNSDDGQTDSMSEIGASTTTVTTDYFIFQLPNGYIESSTSNGELIGVEYVYTEETSERSMKSLFVGYSGKYLNNNWFDDAVENAELRVQNVGDYEVSYDTINRANGMTIDIYTYGDKGRDSRRDSKIYISHPGLSDGQPVAALTCVRENDTKDLQNCERYYNDIIDFIVANVELR